MKPYVYPKCEHKTPEGISQFKLKEIWAKKPKYCPNCSTLKVMKGGA
jgi:hypothetical protein